MTKPAPERFPSRMKTKRRWICWIWGRKRKSGRWERFDSRTLVAHDGHMWHRLDSGELEAVSKLPVCATTGRAASVSDPGTWCPFDVALAAFKRGAADGIGYVLDVGECMLDLDGCWYRGKLNAFAQSVVGKLDTYTERSVSGEGLHIVCVAEGFEPNRGQKGDRVECYVGGFTRRFCTVSGDVLEGHEGLNEDAEDVVSDLYQEEFAGREIVTSEAREDAEEIMREVRQTVLSAEDARAVAWTCGHFKHARAMFQRGDYLAWANERQAYNAIKGSPFSHGEGDTEGRRKLGTSRSEADCALASYLLAATEGDMTRALVLLNVSGMRRDKYDEIHDGHYPYAVTTVANARKLIDPMLMRQRAIERRDERLAKYPPRLHELADLMRRDDVTESMVRRVMHVYATGAANRDERESVVSYPQPLIKWIISRWPRVVELSYTYDLAREVRP